MNKVPGTLFTKPPLITAPVKTNAKISVNNFGIHEAPVTLRIRHYQHYVIFDVIHVTLLIMALIQAIIGENKIRKNRIFRDRLNPLDAYDDYEFLLRYRMTRQCLMDIIDIERADVMYETKSSRGTDVRYYATGSFQQVIGDIMGFSQPSVSKSLKKSVHCLFKHCWTNN